MNDEVLDRRSLWRSRMPIGFILLLLLAVLLVVGFDARALKRVQGDVNRLSLPEGIYLSVGWLSEQELMVAFRPSEQIEWGHGLWQISLSSSTLQPVSWQDDRECKARRLEMPQRLPDGKLSYLLRCVDEEFQERNHILIYDPDVGSAVSQTRGVSMALMEIDPLTGSYSWDADLNSLLVAGGGHAPGTADLYRGIRTQDQEIEIEPIPTPAGYRYQIGAIFDPVGEQITLLASDEPSLLALFRVMANRPVSSYNLYVLEQDLSTEKRLVRNLFHPSVPTWSPDGRWIAIGGEVGSFVKTEGLWLVKVSTGQLRLLTRGYFRRPAWSPDGGTVVALAASDQYSLPDGVVVVEVTHLLD